MQNSPLQLKRYFLQEVCIRANEKYKPESKLSIKSPVKLRANVCRMHRDTNPREWKVNLTVTLEGEDPGLPYFLAVKATGFFLVVEAIEKSRVEDIIAVNAPAMLFGAIREVVAQLTGRGPYPPFILPSVTFIDEKPKNKTSEKNKSNNMMDKSIGRTRAIEA